MEVGHGQDSILLEKIAFEKEEEEEEGEEEVEEEKKKLHPIEQAVLLALCLKEGRGAGVSGDGGLTAEQVGWVVGGWVGGWRSCIGCLLLMYNTVAHSNRLVLLYLPITQPPTHPPTHPR